MIICRIVDVDLIFILVISEWITPSCLNNQIWSSWQKIVCWMGVASPCNTGKWRFRLGSPDLEDQNPVADNYWEGEQPNLYIEINTHMVSVPTKTYL